MRAANAVPLMRLCGWRLLAVGSDEGDGGASASDLRAAQLRVTELERTNSSLTKRARTAEARVAGRLASKDAELSKLRSQLAARLRFGSIGAPHGSARMDSQRGWTGNVVNYVLVCRG